MDAVLLQIATFFLFSIALLALLPLVAKRLLGRDANTFTLLLAAMGTGAITTANSLSVAVQLALPDWVRARGRSIY